MQIFEISTDSARIDIDTVHELLQQSHWAAKRTRSNIEKSIKNSLCFGAYAGTKQIGFARVVTDSCTFAYLCDVFVDKEFRGHGVARGLLEAVTSHPELQGLHRMLLATSSAHGLYKKFNFQLVPDNKFMEILDDNV